MTSPTSGTIAIVGAGPRGASLLERIGAHTGTITPLSPQTSLVIHMVDDAPSGGGRIWRTDQTRDLCMNTLADAVTLFTEPGGTVQGPIVEGPTLFEWCLLALHKVAPSPATEAAVSSIPAARTAGFESHPVRPHFVRDFSQELAELQPESHPSRALYGEYLAWFYDRAVAALPRGVSVIRHYTRAVQLTRSQPLPGETGAAAGADGTGGTGGKPGIAGVSGAGAGRDLLTLADGATIEADTVILATGWLPRTPTPAEARLARQLSERPDLTWVRPASPVEQDLSGVAAGAPAIVRGLGMGFFDTVTLLTLGRGGRFVADPEADGGLRYLPSGDEPRLHVTSRRGVPFRSKSLYGGLPPRAAQRHLKAADWGSAQRPINFDAELWPRIVADAATAHYETLFRTAPESFAIRAPGESPVLAALIAALTRALEELLTPEVKLTLTRAADTGDEQFSDSAGSEAWLTAVARHFDAAAAPFVPHTPDRFSLLREMAPAQGPFSGPGDFNEHIRRYVSHDLVEASLGTESPLKAGLWSFASARAFAGRLGTYGAYDAESRASGFAALQAVGGMVGSGPPAFRNQQLLALIEAGIVRFIGPEPVIEVGPAGFTARSPWIPGSEITAPTLIDAWMHSHDAAASADPLTAGLVREGRARPFRVASRLSGASGATIATGGIDIEPSTGRIINGSGATDESVYCAGIPVDETLHDTIISPMPGSDPTMLRETDRIVRSALSTTLRRAAHVSTHATSAVLANTPPPARQPLSDQNLLSPAEPLTSIGSLND